jgi:hypothetical protein
MNTTEILSKIKTLLGVDEEVVNLAQMKLEDGLTIVESENFAEGDEIVIITEDGKVAMPVGDYKLEDGKMVVVKEEGIIAEVKESGEGEEAKEEEVVEEETKSEETTTPKKVVESITKESFFSEIESLKTENNNLKKELEELKLKSVEKTEEEVVDQKEETTEVELSVNEEVTPIVHNPENKKEFEGYKISQNRSETTLDRVLRKLSN